MLAEELKDKYGALEHDNHSYNNTVSSFLPNHQFLMS